MAPPVAHTAAPRNPETVSGFLLSLLFWLCLLAAAMLFASVTLAPKVLEQARLKNEFDAGQHRLVQIEQQNEQLERVVGAIREDPEFAAEMTRIEFDAVRPDEEIIPVEPSLKLGPQLAMPRPVVPVPATWYQPYLTPLATDVVLRQRLLIGAALLVIVSFTWFQPVSAKRLHRPVGACLVFWAAVKRRYTR